MITDYELDNLETVFKLLHDVAGKSGDTMLTKWRRLVSLVLTLALLLMTCSAALFWMPPKVVKADAGDNYPWKNAPSVPGTGDWGYTTCPSDDSTCMVAKETGSDGNVYGEADPWRVYIRYCTSWVAWALHDRNSFEIPGAFGYAKDWATNAANDKYTVNTTPAVGSVAQWNAYPWNGKSGHVAWVEAVNSSTSIVVEEYNFTNSGGWDQRTVTTSGKDSAMWPNNFIHFKDLSSSSTPTPTPTATPQPSTPFAVVRDTNDIDLVYNDNNNLVWYDHWTASTGWSHLNWADNAAGQPCVVAPDSTDLFFFYRSTTGKLMARTWNETSGVWTGPTALVNSGVNGDPSCVSRDSSDVQAFYLGSGGSVQSVSWASGTWNTNPQTLYTSGAVGDSYAVSRNSDSMEVFFGKNIGNLVHLSWSAEHGWQTEDFSAGAGVTGKPSCIVRNGGNDMSCYYQENNGRVAEQFWDINTGWGWQDWNAQLAGSPSAVPGVTNTIDNFYRETGGNVVDRYFSACGWCTMNIVNAGGATGNPFAVSRGGFDEEVFYWNGTYLMDAHYDTTSQVWSTSQLN